MADDFDRRPPPRVDIAISILVIYAVGTVVFGLITLLDQLLFQ